MSPAATPLLDTALVTLRAPWSVPLSFLGLELTVVTCGILALRHALASFRRGDALPLFTWAVSFTYGLVMEIGSYNFLDSFAHGQFSVMLYRHQLPLYVVTLYPVLQYTSIVTARRLGLGIAAEAAFAGLLIVAMDMPFDILGPMEGWWRWSDTDPVMAYRWDGVPVTSYYWHLAWGALLCAITRAFGRWGADPRRPQRMALLALPLALLTIVLGVISFIPYHVLKARGVADGTVLAGLMALAAVVAGLGMFRAAGSEGGAAAGRDRSLLVIPILYFGYHLLVALARAAGGATPGFGGPMAVIAGVTAAAAVGHLRSNRQTA